MEKKDLHSASERGDLLTVTRLINRGNDVNEFDEVCNTTITFGLCIP